jgi:hypothetical protein
MSVSIWDWALELGIAVGVLAVLAMLYLGWQRIATQREKARRIAAARVRSGHVPLEIPTIRGALSAGASDAPDTYPEWYTPTDGEPVVVNEQPRIHISYTDSHGRIAERIVQVEQLDLHRRVIVARGDFVDDVRIVPLNRIRQARNAESGKPFSLGTWVDAVRVARRRREGYHYHEEDYMPMA